MLQKLNHWLSKENIKDLRYFLGRLVIRYFFLGILVGLLLFFVEYGFAYLIQAFLLKLGATSEDRLHIPDFLKTSPLAVTLGILLGMGFLRSLFQYLRDYLQNVTQEAFASRLRMKVTDWVFSSNSVNSSQTMLLFNERINRSAMTVAAIQRSFFQLSTLIGLGVSLFVLSPLVTLVGLTALFFCGIFMLGIDRKIRKLSLVFIEEWNSATTRLLVSIKNLLLLQIYGTLEQEKNLTKNNLSNYYKHNVRYVEFAGVKAATPQFLGLVFICCIALVSVKNNALSGGLLLSYFYLFIRFVQSLAEVATFTGSIVMNGPQLTNLRQWWDQHTHLHVVLHHKQKSSHDTTPLPAVGWNVNSVSFSYSSDLPSVFSSLNLSIKPKECLVIMGPSGVGKSTLLNLLIGGLTPQSGSVQINTGVETLSLHSNRPKLLASLGYVGPEPFLIEGTILENLKYGLGQRQPSADEIDHVLKITKCDFVNTMSKGLHHHISEQGHGLSAGQKQRIALARALLRKPSALILDEATANLDAETEKQLIESLMTMKKQLTIVAVTHRKAMLSIADQVLDLSGLGDLGKM